MNKCDPNMTSILRVVFTLTWDPVEVAGGVHILENGTKLYLHGSGVPVIYDIARGLNYTLETSFAEYEDAVGLVANNISDLGGLVMSQAIKWKDYGLGSSFVYLHPLDYESSFVYFRQPATDAIRTTLTRPFTFNLWITLILLMILVSLLAKRTAVKFKISVAFEIILFAFKLLLGRHYIHFRVTQVPTSVTLSRLTVSFLGIVMYSLYTAEIASIFVMRDILVKTPKDLIKYGYDINTYSIIHVNRIFEDLNVRNEALKKFRIIEGINAVSNVIVGKYRAPKQTLFTHPDGFFHKHCTHLNMTKSYALSLHFSPPVKPQDRFTLERILSTEKCLISEF